MTLPRALLIGLSIPLFVAPVATLSCSSDSEATAPGGNAGVGAGDTGGTGGVAAAGGGQGGNAGGGGAGGGLPACGDGTPAADQLCFGAPASFDSGDAVNPVSALAVGEWNGGGADVIFGHGKTVSYLAGDGTGSLAGAKTVSGVTVTTAVRDLDVGQLDSGTNLDIVMADGGSRANIVFGDGVGGVVTSLFAGNGEGTCVDVHVADIAGSVATSDVILVCDSGYGSVAMLSGTEGIGAVTAASQIPNDVVAGVLARTSVGKTSALYIAEGVSSGAPTATLRGQSLAVAGSALNITALPDVPLADVGGRLAAGDLNADGIDDIAVIVASDALNILIGDGSDAWVMQAAKAYSSYSVGSSPLDVAMADLDGDGDIDVAVTNSGNDTITVLLNDGAGKLMAHTIQLATGAAPSRLALGDLNGDKVADIVVSTSAPNDITVILSNP